MHKKKHIYSDGSCFEESVLESKNGIVTIDPLGAYVTSWKVRDPHHHQLLDILYRGSSKKRAGIPILFPYFGKAKYIRQHGFGRDSMWHIRASSQSHIILELSSDHIEADAKKEYPYKFHASLEIKIDDSGSLFYNLSVQNIGNEDLPISPGIHPYWDIQQEDKKKIKVKGLQGFDATAFDWDNNPPDIRCAFDKKVILSFPQRNIYIEDISEEAKITQIAVWSQAIDKPDFNFVCFEPICGPDYAIDESPILVPSQKEWQMRLKFLATIL